MAHLEQGISYAGPAAGIYYTIQLHQVNSYNTYIYPKYSTYINPIKKYLALIARAVFDSRCIMNAVFLSLLGVPNIESIHANQTIGKEVSSPLQETLLNL